MTTHGGKRSGAGRKPREQGLYDCAFDYLVAVARGVEKASPEQRVSAARAVLPFEQPKRRAPKPSPRPSQLQATEAVQEASADDKAWRERADRIRKKHGRSE